MFHTLHATGPLPSSSTVPTSWRLLSTASLAAMISASQSQEASAALSAGQVVGGTFDTAPGNVCPGGLSAGPAGVTNVFPTSVPVASGGPTNAVEATEGGEINFVADPSTVTPAVSDFATGLRASGTGSTIAGSARPTITSAAAPT